MMSWQTQKQIVKDIQDRFSLREKNEFKKYLKHQCCDQEDYEDAIAIMNKEKLYEDLDTLARDNFIDAYLKMHLRIKL